MVQVKYVDVDGLPRWPKTWWFGYSSEVNQTAARFIEFAHAPSRRKRWSQMKAMVQALWRGHRI